MGLMLVTGTANTIVIKLQNTVVVGTYEDGTEMKYHHPYF